ncbi:I78 family peptidase inhibitor [Aurantiacibacter luteus]|uniref:Peptidase inhibitor I78 family protein n=1 Tax=Aurantiacibacter luteus TaxID=1581420 RepID=A0A0G9N286_9SPHN|nr:I78 family peptidase inhibitor [Aurantiacibacter luteus]KLE35628.1 hypothetical protein AAW00_04250 [Aurantiacibacter luteus]
MPRLLAFAPLALLAAACQPGQEPGDEPAAAETGETIASGNSDTTPTPSVTPMMVPVPAGEPSTATEPADVADSTCGADKVGPWIGQEATVPVRRAVVEAARPGSDRWIYPDSMVTTDRREDRLNVVMERGTDRFVSAHCG